MTDSLMIKITLFKALILCVFMTLSSHSHAKQWGLEVGTDIPYQYKVAVSHSWDRLEVHLHTGVLTKPYSQVILNLIHALGTEQIYIDLLTPSFQLGWMNGFSMRYQFGKNRSWFVGPEIKLDHLIAQDTPRDLLEIVTGQNLNSLRINPQSTQVSMGLNLLSVGVRVGKSFAIDKKRKHFIRLDVNAFKHLSSRSFLQINNQEPKLMNQELDQLLWEEVFQPYGYFGGVSVTYLFKIGSNK